MPDMSEWIGDALAFVQRRGDLVWQRICERPTEITVIRSKTETLAPQTVRIEYSTAEREVRGDSGAVGMFQDCIVFGVYGHETIPDTNLRRSDRFSLNGQVFRIDSLVYVPGGIQAKGVAIS